MKDPSSLNITGEAGTDITGSKESTFVKSGSNFKVVGRNICNLLISEYLLFIPAVLHFNRSIIMKSYSDGVSVFENGISLILKPEIWFNYNLRTNKTVTVSNPT